jgi:hypothetical protein
MQVRDGVVAALVLCLVVPISAAQVQKQGTPTAHGALYLVGKASVTRIDLQTHRARVWSLLPILGFEVEDICSAGHPPMTCDWSASGTIIDTAHKRLYFSAPDTEPGYDPDSDPDGEGRGPYAVWAIDLKAMKVLHKFEDVGFAPPSMILTRDAQQLLFGHNSYDNTLPANVDTFDTNTFARVSSVKNAGKSASDTYFPPYSYFLPDGKFIIEGGISTDSRIRVASGHFQEEHVDPSAQLPPKEKEKLRAFVETLPDGQKGLPYFPPTSSRNGKTLNFVENVDKTKTAFWTVDMETGATSAATITDLMDQHSVAQLISSGNEFAAFEGKVSKPSDGGYRFVRTGRVFIYNATTGELVKKFDKPELSGVGDVLCLSPDGLSAAYAKGSRVSLLDFTTGNVTPLAAVRDLPQPNFSGACAFTE